MIDSLPGFVTRRQHRRRRDSSALRKAPDGHQNLLIDAPPALLESRAAPLSSDVVLIDADGGVLFHGDSGERVRANGRMTMVVARRDGEWRMLAFLLLLLLLVAIGVFAPVGAAQPARSPSPIA